MLKNATAKLRGWLSQEGSAAPSVPPATPRGHRCRMSPVPPGRETGHDTSAVPGQGWWGTRFLLLLSFRGTPRCEVPRGGEASSRGHVPDSGKPRAFILFN